jgi:hypothetical protein
MDFYFSAPKWDPKKPGFLKNLVPTLSVSATAVEWEDVNGQTVIHIARGMYRNATVNGNFLLDKSVKLPLAKLGKRRIQVYCKWHGHRLKSDRGISILVELPLVQVEEGYIGKVVSNIAKRTAETK